MAKVSKNQRTDRVKNRQQVKMAKIVVAEKKPNGQYRFRERIVPLEAVNQAVQAG
ncbi:DUF4295 family protein [Rhodothermus marinus]|uniref:DUF4295 domain-containing protein n=1 Tax=Rhodothermus marinus (strain ATCC 43812 / DSM 4252 / R-10) TaxID=518766 RepID=D0MK15_RHOM4|nr:DUF4295 family protein [Rhodothermus marinus]ACY46928.1 hypothetical protein Rmar_0019 [Rhodothermus marinus DSM 4252]